MENATSRRKIDRICKPDPDTPTSCSLCVDGFFEKIMNIFIYSRWKKLPWVTF